MSAARKSATIKTWLSTTTIAAGLMVSVPAAADNWTNLQGSGFSTDTSIANQTNISQHQNIVKARGDLDITENHTVNIHSGNSSSIFAAWDVEGDATHILGKLNADGRVFVFNKNGVIFGANSVVDVGGIIASTGSLSDEDIALDDGKFQFDDVDTGGKIVLDGSISVADGGLAAFVAPQVVNNGLIVANKGTVALASGNKVTLDLYGDNLIEIAVDDKSTDGQIDNTGIINAGGGKVAMSVQTAKDAVDNVINTSGIIDVTSVEVKGGKIILGGGETGKVKVSGKLKANGKTGGGKVKVTGKNIHVTETAKISADAEAAGNGGRVDIVAQNGLVFDGLITARGGLLGGDGGFVDTSGLEWVDILGNVDASATNGLAGTWLIDPRDLEIVSGSSSNVTGFTPDGSGRDCFFGLCFGNVSKLSANSIQQALNSSTGGTNVLVTTVNSPNISGHDGTITIKANIEKNHGGQATLTLNAAGSIIQNTNSTITSKSNALAVTMTAAKDIDLKGTINTKGGAVNLNANDDISLSGTINTAGGALRANAGNNLTNTGTLNTANGHIDLISRTTGSFLDQGGITHKGSINAGNGKVTFDAKNDVEIDGTVSAGSVEVKATDDVEIKKAVTASGGNVKVNGRSATIANTASITTTGGAVDISADSDIDLGGVVTTNGGSVVANAGNNVTNKATINTSNGDVALTSKNTGSILLDIGGITLEGSINAGNGKVTFDAKNDIVIDGAVTAKSVDIKAADDIDVKKAITTSNGAVDLNGRLVTVHNSGSVKTNGGKISVKAEGGNDGGLEIHGNGSLNAGNGEISISRRDNGILSIGDRNGLELFFGNLFGDSLFIEQSEIGNMTAGTLTVGETAKDERVYLGDANLTKFSNTDIKASDAVRVYGNNSADNLSLSAGNDIEVQGRITANNDIDFKAAQNVILDKHVISLSGDIKAHTSVDNFTIRNGGKLAANTGDITFEQSGIFKSVKNSVDTSGNGNTYIRQNQGGKIQDAVDAIIVSGDGDNTVDVTSGTYAETVTVNKKLNLLGANQGKATGVNSVTRDSESEIKSGGIIVTAADVLIDGFKINQASSHGVDIQANDVTLSNTVISSSKGDGVKVGAVKDIEISNNLIQNSFGKGIFAIGNEAASVLKIKNNDVFSSSSDGIYLKHWNGALVEGNKVDGTQGHGIALERAFNTKLLNNEISGVTSAGINLWYGNQDTTIQGNTIYGSKYGIQLETAGNQSNSGTVIGFADGENQSEKANHISNVEVGIKATNASALRIAGNEVDETNGNGIDLSDSDDAVILGNKIGTLGGAGINGDGIYISSSDGVIISANTIKNTKSSLNDVGNGIHLTGSNKAIIGGTDAADANIISDIAWDGIKISGGADNTVENNTVSKVARVGIYAGNTSDLTVHKNTVSSQLGGYGAIASDGGSDLTVSENIVSSSPHGISMNNAGGTNTISGNEITDVTDSGVYAEGTAGLTISGNTVDGAKTGVTAKKTEGAKIIGNTVTSSVTGIDVSDAKNIQVMSNDITSADGVRADKAKNLWVYNNDINASTHGIHVTDSAGSSYGSDDIDLWKNRITGAGTAGILVENSAFATIGVHQNNQFGPDGIDMGNVIKTSGQGVVVKDSANAMIRFNTIDDIGGDAISVSGGSTVNILNNKIGAVTGAGYGITVDQSNNATIQANSINRANVGILVLKSDGATIGGSSAGLGNTITKVADGIAIRADGVTANGHLVQGNIIDETSRTGIYLANVTNSTVDSNQVGNTGRYASIYALGGGNNWITGNDIDGSDEVGILIDQAGLNFNFVINNKIDFTGKAKKTSDGMNSGDAVYVRDTSNIVVADNKIGMNGGGIKGNGVSVDTSTNAQILSNKIQNVANTGIRIKAGASDIQISDNILNAIGNEGIRSEQVKGLTLLRNTLGNVSWNGIEVQGGSDAVLERNTLTDIRGNGIQVSGTNRSTLKNNTVSGIRLSGIVANDAKKVSITDNLVSNTGQDAISAARNEALEVLRNFVGFADKAGTEAAPGNIGRNGISISRSNGSIIEDNKIVNAANNGLQISGSGNVTALGNVITNSGARGLYASGANNGLITLVGNTFTDNKIGAEFESGEIDLTVSANSFTGGETALRFDPTIGGNALNLKLVRNSIGETVFDGQSRFFVELANGAFYAPGNPGIIDGEHATYNGFRPDTVPFLSVAQYNALEGQLYHFADDSSLGLFFFGLLPAVDQSDLFRDINGFAAGARGLSITIRGLPLLPGAASVAQSFSASSLANIAPAAGGDASDVANIEPAAGGDEALAEEAPVATCWGGALAGTVDGGAVTYSMSPTMDGALADAASCEVSSL